MINKKNISVCFTSNDFHRYADEKSIVVVVDLLRATSVISTAFECGVSEIIPVANLKDALKYKSVKDHIIAAERNTLPIKGFDYGNSPYHYINSDVKNKTLVLTTTNGTRAILVAKEHQVITASFVNIDAVVKYLVSIDKNIIILCSGWKGLFSLEDTIFSGALSDMLLQSNQFFSVCDSMKAAIDLYSIAKVDLFKYLAKSAYRNRNSLDDVIRDTKFCLKPTINSNIVPIFRNGKLIKG